MRYADNFVDLSSKIESGNIHEVIIILCDR